MENNPSFFMNQLRRNSSFRMQDSHTHTSFELYYLLSGRQKFFIQHTVYSMHPYDLALILPGTLHRTNFSSTSTHERIVIMFEAQYIQEILDFFPSVIKDDFHSQPVISIPLSMREEVDTLFTKMFAEYEKKDCFSSHLLSHYLCELFFLITRCKNGEQTLESSSTQDEAIGSAAYFISKYYQHHIKLEDAAKIANLSPTYFSKKFKSVTGFGFKEYLNSIRIQKACSELLQTEDSVTDIALRCGFENSNYFGDIFYKINGVSPRAFRTQHSKSIKKYGNAE